MEHAKPYDLWSVFVYPTKAGCERSHCLTYYHSKEEKETAKLFLKHEQDMSFQVAEVFIWTASFKKGKQSK